MPFESTGISKARFGMPSPGANLNVATVRAFVVQPLYPNSNYFNNTEAKNHKHGLCQLANHNCPKKQSQLIICYICLGTTPAGNTINVMKMPATAVYCVYNFKDMHMSLLEDFMSMQLMRVEDF